MWWLKVVVIAAAAINLGSGNPLVSDKLHNVEEVKFKEVAERKAKLFEPETYRLPNTSIPIDYDITLRTDIHNGVFDFSGHVLINIRVQEETDEIVLHYRQINVDFINLLNSSSGEEIASDLAFTKIPSHEFLVITLPANYTANTELKLEISYFGRVRDDGGGFYYGNYTNAAGNLVFYATTQFEIDDARHAMPCYDEPGIRAPMTLTMVHGKKFSAVANMEVNSTTPFGAYTITKFKPTPSMQTYLLAFLVSDFDYVEASPSRVSQRIYAKPAAIAEGEGDYAASVVGLVLSGLESSLNVTYPNTKMDHVALNYFNFGAMENFGLITYIDSGLLMKTSLTESLKYSRENSIVGLIAHEYAHQYFGNIVSPKWWTYTWLNEGFATLFASYIPSLIYPERKPMTGFITGNLPRAFSNDVNGSWAMNHYTEIPSELWSKFGAIGYQKSGCVLRMFMEVMTHDTFLKGLNIYLQDNLMQAATPEELHAGLQAAYDADFPSKPLNIGELMYTWENQPGFPLISVSISGSDLKFTQRRYPVSNGEIYSVPLTFATKSSPDFAETTPKQWLRGENSTFTQAELNFNASDNDWIVLNNQQVGYYRVDYDTTLWRAIIDQLNTNHSIIDPINRAVLQDEVRMAWTELSRVTAGDVLDTLSYFGKEDEPIAWNKAQSTITTLYNRLFGTSAFASFLKLLTEITSTHLDVHGFSGFDGENPEITALRSHAKTWSCRGLDGKCLINEYALFASYYFNNSKDVVFDYCNALKLIGQPDFDTILNNVLTDLSYENRGNYLANLGCSVDPVHLLKFLNATLVSTNNLSASERTEIIANTFSKSAIAMSTTLGFIEDNHEALRNIASSTLLVSIAAFVNGQPNTAQFQSVMTRMQSVGVVSSDQIGILSGIVASNNRWIDDNYKAVLDFFGLVETTTVATTQTSAVTTQPSTPTQTSAVTTQPSTPTQTSTASSVSSTVTTAPTTTTPASGSSIFLSLTIFLFCAVVSSFNV